MRYDTPIRFCSTTQGTYDPETGDYGDDTQSKDTRFCCVQTTGMEAQQILYGKQKQDAKTVTILNRYKGEYDSVEIGGKLYHVDRTDNLRTKQILYISEVK